MAQFIILFILVILFTPFSINAADFITDIEYLENYSIKESRVVDITDLEIGLMYGKAVLDEGELYLTGYLDNVPTAAFFVGDGYFVYNPPDDIEKQQVNRFYGTDSIYYEFDKVFFAFPGNSKILGFVRWIIFVQLTHGRPPVSSVRVASWPRIRSSRRVTSSVRLTVVL